MLNEKITIVTTTYNRLKELKVLLNSILNQTYKNIKWLLIDDGSNDKTSEWFKNIVDIETEYFYKKNSGVNKARMYSNSLIDTDYVLYIDSDDYFYDTNVLVNMVKDIKCDDKCLGVAYSAIDQYKKSYSFLKNNKIKGDFETVVSETKLKGEFIYLYKWELIKNIGWPDYDGFEIIRHWEIVSNGYINFYSKIGRIYTRGERDSLSSKESLIRRSESLSKASMHLLGKYGHYLKKNETKQYVKYVNYNKFYCILCGDKKYIVNNIKFSSVLKSGYKELFKYCILTLLEYMPYKLSVKLFMIKK